MDAPPSPDARRPTYRLRDLGNVPCLLSLARVPLAGVFALAVGDPHLALGVILLSGLTDLLDGWWARRFDQTTDLGGVLDGVTDKVFVLVVALTLGATGRLSVAEVLLLGVRDLGEALLLGVAVARHDPRLGRVHPRADVFGKATTLLQFAAVALALFGHPLRSVLAWGAGALGAFAAVHYARRAE